MNDMEGALVHARAASLIASTTMRRKLGMDERGQGTVEYVGLVLLVAVLMGGMVAAVGGLNSLPGKELAEAITKKIVQAVQKVSVRRIELRPRPSVHRRVRVGPRRSGSVLERGPWSEDLSIAGMTQRMSTRSYERTAADPRPVSIEPGYVKTADGSALIYRR